MARLRIEHLTYYGYHRPVALGRHRLVLRPREGHDQHVESLRLDITPAHDIYWLRDVFGNSVAVVDFNEPSEELSIRSEVVVRRSTPFPGEALSTPALVPFPLVYDPLETTMVTAYRSASYPDDLDEIEAWLKPVIDGGPAEDAEALLHKLGRLVHDQIKYRRRMEKGVNTPAATLRSRSGSCRDLATLMMDAARYLGVAARFASGYLDCPASVAGRASMHAWVELYLPGVGWRGYDPTIGEPTSLKHVVTGVSNHPRGVMPVSGMFTGTSADYREMIVTVKTEKLPNLQELDAPRPPITLAPDIAIAG